MEESVTQRMINRLVEGDKKPRLQKVEKSDFDRQLDEVIEIAREHEENIVDYRRKLSDVSIVGDNGVPMLWDRQSDVELPFTSNGFSQFTSRVAGAGVGYFKKCLKEGMVELVVENLNRWAQVNPSKSMLFRVFNGEIMASLTSNYTPVTHVEILESLRNGFEGQSENLSIERFSANQEDLIVRILDERQKIIDNTDGQELTKSGLEISNGNTGLRPVTIDYLTYTLVCSNGLFTGENQGRAFYQKHRRWDRDMFHFKVMDTARRFPNYTREVKDFVEGARRISADEFGRFVNRKTAVRSTDDRLKEFMSDFFKFDKDELDDVFVRWNDYERNVWGLAAAVTDFAQDFDHEKQESLERRTGEMIDFAVRS